MKNIIDQKPTPEKWNKNLPTGNLDKLLCTFSPLPGA